jgi:nitrous oxide reductase accessory protein NosL
MRNFSKILILSLLLLGCDSKMDTSPKDAVLDRDVCHRCKMAISDKHYVSQIVNPKDAKRYFFDDIGCAILWMQEQNITWEQEAFIYVANAKNGEWLDAKKAVYSDKANSPMRFGFAAHFEKSENSDVEYFSFEEVKQSVYEANKQKMQAKHDEKSMAHHNH